MKKRLILTTLVMFACVLAFAKEFKVGKKVYVSVKKAVMKSSTAYFSETLATLKYGDFGIVVESDSKNTKIKLDSGLEGWISTGSLTSKKVVANSSATRVSSSELANAGKGFSAEAERAFKSSGKSVNYSEVDSMEKIKISDADLQAFIEEGHLNGGTVEEGSQESDEVNDVVHEEVVETTESTESGENGADEENNVEESKEVGGAE